MIDAYDIALPRKMCILDVGRQLAHGDQVVTHLHPRATSAHLPATTLPWVDGVEARECLLGRALVPIRHSVGVHEVDVQILLALQR
ncbi:hypothetical protein [Pseudoxanthomonas sp. PXM01]|uniref:hypothetical protein n=1 Tax=Pseudoxanthomonas sp. PXM01 TaxID=2769295 RepID=UPI002106C1DE|nr:hypothetical protein [Pseudoxanthomonas sp. PXM01]